MEQFKQGLELKGLSAEQNLWSLAAVIVPSLIKSVDGGSAREGTRKSTDCQCNPTATKVGATFNNN